MHEEVAQSCALGHDLRADEVSAGSDGDASLAGVLGVLARRYQPAEIVKLAGPIGVGEDNILAACMAHAVSDGATFAAILLERHDTNAARRDAGGVTSTVRPGPG